MAGEKGEVLEIGQAREMFLRGETVTVDTVVPFFENVAALIKADPEERYSPDGSEVDPDNLLATLRAVKAHKAGDHQDPDLRSDAWNPERVNELANVLTSEARGGLGIAGAPDAGYEGLDRLAEEVRGMRNRI